MISQYIVYKEWDLIDTLKIGSKIRCISYNGITTDCIYLGFNFNNTINVIIDDEKITIGLSNIKEIRVIEGDEEMSKKEQLLNELEQIKKEFNEKIENVQKQIEKESVKNKWWIPKQGEQYWYIDSIYGTVFSRINMFEGMDNDIINNLNYYKTREQAERQAFEELLHRKLKKFMVENNSKVDWSNDDNKFDIWYDYEDKQFNTGCYESARDFAQIYFSSEEIAEKAIEEFKDDLIRYFTSDK